MISTLNPLTPAAAGTQDSHGKVSLQQLLRNHVIQALGLPSTTHGIHGIAGALRDKLANADADAPDAVPDLLKSINDALEQASKALADQGVDQKTIDAAVRQFRGRLAREIDSLVKGDAPTPVPGPAATRVDAVATRQVVKEKFSLDIVTAENDHVSIRFRSTDISEFAAAKTTSGSGTALVAGAHVISRGQLQIAVQGDLSDTELTAIGDLLDKVNGIAEDFFGGDVQAAFAAASRVDFDSQALSSFDLKLKYSQSVAYARQYSDTAALISAPAAKAPSAGQPVLAPISVATPVAPPQPAAPVDTTPATPVLDAPTPKSAKVSDPSIDVPAPTAAPSAKATIASFAKEVLARLDSVSDAGTARFSLRWKVDFLLTAISATAARKPDAQPAAAALNGTLSQAVPAAS